MRAIDRVGTFGRAAVAFALLVALGREAQRHAVAPDNNNTHAGVPIFVKNVAEVVIGPQPRVGIVGFNEFDDVVPGIVLLIKGSNTTEVLKGVKEKIDYLNVTACLPESGWFPSMTELN